MMRTIRINKWIGGAALVLAGLLAGYLLFSGGAPPHDRENGATAEHAGHQDTGEENGGIEYWTCSMHPSVRADEPGDCPICGMDLIPAYEEEDEKEDAFTMTMSDAAMQLARIRTTPVVHDIPEKIIRLPGRIKVDERQITNVTAHFPGRIRTLHVDFTGAPIRKGQPMATIYSPELIGAQRELLEAAKRADRSPRMVESAREKLRRWELSDTQIRNIEQQGEVQTDLEILSPVDGFVLTKNISMEQHVDEGTILYEAADLSRLWAVFEAYESDIEWISTGDIVEFQLRGQPGETHEATIDYIDPVVDPESRTVDVRADIENPGGRLKPEMLAYGEISARMTEEQLMVPTSAVLWTGPRSILFVMDTEGEQPRFEAREVTLGPESGDFRVITEGVEEGEVVVSHGAFRVDSEFQLADRRSMMNREPGQGAVPVHDHGMGEDSGMEDDTADSHENMDMGGMDMDETGPSDIQQEVSDNFRADFTGLIHQYLNIHEALFESDLQKAREAGKNFMQTLASIGEHRMSGDAHMAWMEFYQNLEAHAAPIEDGEDLEQVRDDFRFLSNILIEALISLGAETDFYQQFCPMAFDGQGANWISDRPDIQNPYLPETMPGCGEVEKEITSGGRQQTQGRE
ncbi:MAG: efflux RND transporter periplasmic adaptor subunit [Desulfosalsimonadaceae bacterium]